MLQKIEELYSVRGPLLVWIPCDVPDSRQLVQQHAAEEVDYEVERVHSGRPRANGSPQARVRGGLTSGARGTLGEAGRQLDALAAEGRRSQIDWEFSRETLGKSLATRRTISGGQRPSQASPETDEACPDLKCQMADSK